MTEEIKKNEQSGRVTWIKHIAAAIIGAVISFATAFGLLSKPEGEVAKDAANAAIEKSEQTYVQVTAVSQSIAEIKQLIDEKKYVEAITKLDDIGQEAKGAIQSVTELKDQLGTIITLVKEKTKKGEEDVPGGQEAIPAEGDKE